MQQRGTRKVGGQMLEKSLDCFCAVAEAGNFSRAAEKMYLTQPSVSRYVAELENEWGMKLFERNGRTTRLTYEGRVLYDLLQKTRDTWDKTLTNLRSAPKDLSGTLRVGLFSGWATRRFVVLNRFMEKYPSVRLDVQKVDQVELNRQLLSGELDVIFQLGIHVDDTNPELGMVELCQSMSLVRIAATHPLAAKAQTIRDLAGMDLFVLGMEHSGSFYEYACKLVRRYNWNLNVVPYPNVETIRTAVELHMGGSLLSSMGVIPSENPDSRYYTTGQACPVMAVWNKRVERPVVQAFLNELGTSPTENLIISA